ncbi:MAG: VCBS repeat-containing protein [Nitrospiraceae bacterium]|nr:MAG: VCBS repeat-containing protein [Nitrospiraceae bacterium]
MGSYPTVVDWNNDNLHDLLVGDTNGNVIIYKNMGSNTAPVLDSGTIILNTGDDRATSVVADWNGDGKKDLLVGTWSGNIQVYLNNGTDTVPAFSSFYNLQVGGSEFNITPPGFSGNVGGRAAPRVYDWNHDGKQDLLVGEVEGYIYYLQNVGTNSEPVFNSYERLLVNDGNYLQYGTSYPRSRLFVTDWNEDGLEDIILGGSDGRLQIYTSVVPEPVSSALFLAGSGVIGFRSFRKKFKIN